jgi:hypothetical protein
MYSNGGSNTGMFGNGYGLMVGGHYQGFSAEAVYTEEHGAVNLQTAVNDASAPRPLRPIFQMAKYTWELGGRSLGSYPTKAPKADVGGDKLSIFAGYTRVD